MTLTKFNCIDTKKIYFSFLLQTRSSVKLFVCIKLSMYVLVSLFFNRKVPIESVGKRFTISNKYL